MSHTVFIKYILFLVFVMVFNMPAMWGKNILYFLQDLAFLSFHLTCVRKRKSEWLMGGRVSHPSDAETLSLV